MNGHLLFTNQMKIIILGKMYYQVKVQTLISIIQKKDLFGKALWGKTNIPEGALGEVSIAPSNRLNSVYGVITRIG